MSSTDWVTAQIMAVGGAAARKLQRLRDAADHSMNGSPAHQDYGRFYDTWLHGDLDTRRQLRDQAEAEEAWVWKYGDLDTRRQLLDQVEAEEK